MAGRNQAIASQRSHLVAAPAISLVAVGICGNSAKSFLPAIAKWPQPSPVLEASVVVTKTTRIASAAVVALTLVVLGAARLQVEWNQEKGE